MSPIRLREGDYLAPFERDGKRYTICPLCLSEVELNGPGSNETFVGRVAMKLAWTLTREAQELFTSPAADLHDLQGHIGLKDEAENKEAAKQYRDACYNSIREKYKPIVDELEQKRSDCNLLLKFFYWRKKSIAKRRWKGLELIAELHYDILVRFGPDYMIKPRCYDKYATE